MHPSRNQDLAKLKRLLSWYNQVPNVIWSVLNLMPISLFCYHHVSLTWLFGFIGLSLLPIFLPNSFFDKIQAGKTTAFYKKLGVDKVNKVTQNGSIVHKLIRKKYPSYKAITYERTILLKRFRQTYFYEKFHFIFFVFFTLTTIYALYHSYWQWAVVLFVTNLIYNIYPNLLQQYIRLKLKVFNPKST